MPFTLSHPAAVIPFMRRRGLLPSALVVGCMAPDFEYFICLSMHSRRAGHTLPGLFHVSFPPGPAQARILAGRAVPAAFSILLAEAVVFGLWLIMGILSMAFLFYFFPTMSRQIAQSGAAGGEGVPGILQVVMVLVFFPIYILLPGAFVLFYRSRHVRETCRALDPQRRWTDDCPLPVLALIMMMGLGLYSMLFLPFYNFVIPCFGVILSGIPGIVLWLLMTALLLALIRGLYRLRAAAWWGMVVLIPLGGLSGAVSMRSENLPLMYEKMGIATQQVQAMLDTGFFQGPGMLVYMLAASAAMLGYVFYTKRYFDAATDSWSDRHPNNGAGQ